MYSFNVDNKPLKWEDLGFDKFKKSIKKGIRSPAIKKLYSALEHNTINSIPDEIDFDRFMNQLPEDTVVNGKRIVDQYKRGINNLPSKDLEYLSEIFPDLKRNLLDAYIKETGRDPKDFPTTEDAVNDPKKFKKDVLDDLTVIEDNTNEYPSYSYDAGKRYEVPAGYLVSKEEARDFVNRRTDPEFFKQMLKGNYLGDTDAHPILPPDGDHFAGLTKEESDWLVDLTIKDLDDEDTFKKLLKLSKRSDASDEDVDDSVMDVVNNLVFGDYEEGMPAMEAESPVNYMFKEEPKKKLLNRINKKFASGGEGEELSDLEKEVYYASPEHLLELIEQYEKENGKEIKPIEEAGAFLSKEDKKGLLKEAEQVGDGDKRTDEVADKVSEPVAEALDIPKEDVEEAIESKQPLNEGYKDGQLERNEEQQAEFNKAKQEADEEARRWREQQFNREPVRANEITPEQSNGIAETESAIDDGEQLAESASDYASYADKMIEAFSHDHRKDKHPGKNREERLASARKELEDLEFNPNDFLTDEEKNDIDYKPSQEELDAFNKAQREEWEANGRPRNKDVEDKTIDMPEDLLKKNVEDAIESNPEAAQEAIPDDNPLQQEAEQVEDGDARTDEVNNEALEQGLEQNPEIGVNLGGANLDGVGSQLTPNQVYNQELTAPYDPNNEYNNPNDNDLGDVFDPGLNDLNDYKGQSQPIGRAAPKPHPDLNEFEDKVINSDDTLVSEAPEPIDVERVPEEELRRIFDPLNKEIEARSKAVNDAEEKLALAQMHFDDNPNEENAQALQKADAAFKDAQFLLDRKQDEFKEAYENLNNYYQIPEEEETPEEEKSLGLSLHLPHLSNQRSGGVSEHNPGSAGSYSQPTNQSSHSNTQAPGSRALGNIGSHSGLSGIAPMKEDKKEKYHSPMGSTASMAPTYSNQVQKDNPAVTSKPNTIRTPQASTPFGKIGLLGKGGTIGINRTLPTSGTFAQHTSTPAMNNMAIAGGSNNNKPIDMRQSLIIRLKNDLAKLSAEEKARLGFSKKAINYQGRPFDEMDGPTLKKLIDLLESK